MAREIPSAPKVYTTTYDNFKGVDFTNDQTNVWRRRSPSGVNMLPDASGRPFKRHGWDILLSHNAICTALSVDDCQITKCAYFELAGVDHIVVFTDRGVLFYNGDPNATTYTTAGVTAINTTDAECYGGYDRCFFFEGGGTSAFYIYGDYRMWRYDADFSFAEVSGYIPTVVASASADGTGTIYEPYNLLYNMASVQYHDNQLFTYWGTKKLIFEVDQTTFDLAHSKNYSQTFTYDADNNVWKDQTTPTPQSFTPAQMLTMGINVIEIPTYDDGTEPQITVINVYGLLLPNNLDLTNQVTRDELVSVFVSKVNPMDTELYVRTATPSTGECCVKADIVPRDNPQAWIEFYAGDFNTTPPVYKTGTDFDEQDAFKVVFPSTQISMTEYSGGTAQVDTDKAQLVEG